MAENDIRRPPRAALRPEVTDGILAAVLDELADVGYGKLSMDGVARRARAGKAALYRRWPRKQDMVLDAMAGISLPVLPAPTTGDLAADVAAFVRSVDAWLGDPRMGRILPDLLAEAKRNDELASALTTRVGDARRERGRAMLETAMARGELDTGVDVEYALDLMAAPIFWRVCGLRRDTTPEYLDRVVDTVLHALGADRRD